jgi:DNA-directed RNA polymerase subunit L
MSVNEVRPKVSVLEFEVRGTGDPGNRTFAIGNEDHTLGNALRHVLMQNADVEFAGYSVPHPVRAMIFRML